MQIYAIYPVLYIPDFVYNNSIAYVITRAVNLMR